MRTINLYISYFYQIRNFPPNLIPVSTALWDPKWFHDGKGQKHIWINKDGVLCGVRLPIFSPKDVEGDCKKGCELKPDSCRFIKNYYNHLLSQPKEDYMAALSEVAVRSKEMLGLSDWPDLCLIVHEVPGNPCSERAGIIKFVQEELKLEIQEWQL